MSLKKLHEDWLKGSYEEDLVFILKVAENNDLRKYVPKNAEDRKYLGVNK